MEVLGIHSGSSAREASALNFWATSPVPKVGIFLKDSEVNFVHVYFTVNAAERYTSKELRNTGQADREGLELMA